MKQLTVICFILFLIGVLLFLAQLWFHPWGPELFVKLSLTDGAALVIVFVLNFLIKEHKATRKINDGNSLDQ